jgi:DNA topoisomerase-1
MNGESQQEVASARSAGLQYVSDRQPGIRRLRSGRAFSFQSATGRILKDPAILKRIQSLAVPPAWTKVWICPSAAGHIQATGRDDRGRKQYRYHRHWHEARGEKKFDRMIAFGRALPRIRQRASRDLRVPGLGREKVLATIVCLLDLSAIRVGNDEYVNQNNSFGLTTLRDRHAKVSGSTIHLRFRGKGGKQHALSIENPELARIVKRCQDLPGQELFQWVDEAGEVHGISSGHVNEYLWQIAGQDFTSKDFRTWTGTVVAAMSLCEFKEKCSSRQIKANIARAIEQVAARLGNTPAVCRKSYVHPAILQSYAEGTLFGALRSNAGVRKRRPSFGLQPQEKAMLALLRQKRDNYSDHHLRKKLRLSLSRTRAHRG